MEDPERHNSMFTENPINSGRVDEEYTLRCHYYHYGDEFGDITFGEYIKKIKKYDKIYSVVTKRLKSLPSWNQIDWANTILLDVFFGEAINTRINNVVLVSALLVTVSTSALMSPPTPVYFVPTDDNHQSDIYYAWILFTALSTALYLLSIFINIFFVEQISRAYTDSDRIYMTLKFYEIKNAGQGTMEAATVCLIVSLSLDALMLYGSPWGYVVLTILIGALISVLAIVVYAQQLPGTLQEDHTNKLINSGIIKSEKDGRVRENILDWIEKNYEKYDEDGLVQKKILDWIEKNNKNNDEDKNKVESDKQNKEQQKDGDVVE